MAADGSFPARFRRWRRDRPFLPGLFLILSGVIIMTPAYLTFEVLDILVMVSTISGVSTLILGVLLIMCGLTAWFRPTAAIYAGVLGILFAVIALPTSNFGGFLFGTVLGVIGGAFTLAWDPEAEPRPRSGRRRRRRRGGRGRGGAAMSVPDAGLSDGASPDGADDSGDVLGREADAAPGARGRRRWRVGGALLSAGVATAAIAGAVNAPAVRAEDGARLLPSGVTGVVMADEVVVSGNVRATVTTESDGGRTLSVIELRGDRVEATTLGVDIPGAVGTGELRSDPGSVATLTGSPVILRTASLTATPAIDGHPTVPVSVDVSGVPGPALEALGLPLIPAPGQVMDHVTLRDVRMDVVALYADELVVPGANVLT